MATQDSPSSSEQIVSFMLAEYELLTDARASTIAQNENRLNFFIAVTSGSAALIAFFTNEGTLHDIAFRSITLFVMFLLFLFGLVTSKRLIEGTISIVTYTRGLNRVRRYFSNIDRGIVDYLILPINDDVPQFGAVGFLTSKGSGVNLTVVPILVSSALIAFIIAITLDLIGISLWFVTATGFVSFFLALIAHYLYYKHTLEKARRNTVVMFPAR